MIKTFRCKKTEKIFNCEFSRKLPQAIQQIALRKLNYLHAATSLKDLTIPPSSFLEHLAGDRKGQHSIRINKQWRICFVWRGEDTYNVEITDYH